MIKNKTALGAVIFLQFRFTNNDFLYRIPSLLEESHRGLVQLPAKKLTPKGVRGFESHLLRQLWTQNIYIGENKVKCSIRNWMKVGEIFQIACE